MRNTTINISKVQRAILTSKAGTLPFSKVIPELSELFPEPDPLSSDFSLEAVAEALEKQFEYYDENAPLYRRDVAERHGITEEQLDEIGVEGVLNDWPMPTPVPSP